MVITRSFFLIFLCCLATLHSGSAQEATIRWMDFEQLEDSLRIRPKKVFVAFYADWCAYCKKLDRAAFSDTAVINILNEEYYAVKMDAESQDTIVFEGQSYHNSEVGRKRNPTHEIPLLLATRKSRPFSLPALIVLNAEFKITDRYFEYLSPKKLRAILGR